MFDEFAELRKVREAAHLVAADAGEAGGTPACAGGVLWLPARGICGQVCVAVADSRVGLAATELRQFLRVRLLACLCRLAGAL